MDAEPGAGIPASLDHQTVGGGPFCRALTRDASSPLYKDAVYYARKTSALTPRVPFRSMAG